jgi:hypothetical protein
MNSIVAALGLPLPTQWQRQSSDYSHLPANASVVSLFQTISVGYNKVIDDEMDNLGWLKLHLDDDENIQPNTLRMGNGYISNVAARHNF